MENRIKNIFIVLLLIIISVAIIFYQFPNIPKNLSFDEVAFAKLALSLDEKTYAPYSTLATGHSTLYFYIILFSFKLFGITNFALRFPSAIFGVLSVFVFYFLMKLVLQQFNNLTIKQLYKNKPPNIYHLTPNLLSFILSIIFITSHWYLNFTRFSFEATFLIFLELTSLYFIISWLSNPEGYWKLILSGIFAGLAYNSYTPGRVFFFVPLSILVISTIKQFNPSTLLRVNNLTIKKKAFINLAIKPILSFLIPLIIVIIPLSFYILTNKDDRVDKQFFPKNTEMKLSEKVDFFTRNISSISLMFNFKGDINGRHNYPGKPALNSILGILFIVGLIISIKNYKNLYSLLFIIYFIIALIPATVTYPWENPNMLRTITVLPSVIYFIGIAFNELLTIVTKSLLLHKKKYIRFSLLFIIYSLLFLSSVYELRTYFVFQSKVFFQAFEVKNSLPKALTNLYK